MADPRLIVDLTHPRKGASVNNQCDVTARLYMTRTDDLRDLLRQTEPDVRKKWRGAKRDLADAYWQVPVAIDSVPLLGARVGPRLLFFLRLPFGATLSPLIFGLITFALVWITSKRAARWTERAVLLGYSDDYGIVGHPLYVLKLLKAFDDTVLSLGLQISEKKLATEGKPSTSPTWLGIVFHLARDVMEVTEEAKDKATRALEAALEAGGATLNETQKLLGKLHWVASVRPEARVFLTML